MLLRSLSPEFPSVSLYTASRFWPLGYFHRSAPNDLKVTLDSTREMYPIHVYLLVVVFASPTFHSVSLYHQPFSSYMSTKWLKNDLEGKCTQLGSPSRKFHTHILSKANAFLSYQPSQLRRVHWTTPKWKKLKRQMSKYPHIGKPLATEADISIRFTLGLPVVLFRINFFIFSVTAMLNFIFIPHISECKNQA